MGMKIMLNIQGNFYDLWEVRSLEKSERYDEDAVDLEKSMKYLIILNRTAIATNFSEVIFEYDTEEERDAELNTIAAKLEEYEAVLIIK